MLSRLGHLGQRGREAAGRRRELMVQEERARMEAVAHHTAYVRGRRRRLV